jgi:hypothetical protein
MNNTELGFQVGEAQNDTLIFTHQNIEKQYSAVYLVDLSDNKVADVSSSGSKYAFVSDATAQAVKRFKIITQPVESDSLNTDIKLTVFNNQSIIFVQNYTSLPGECIIYDVAGHTLKKLVFDANTITILPENLLQGVYVVRVVAGTDQVSKRLLVR